MLLLQSLIETQECYNIQCEKWLQDIIYIGSFVSISFELHAFETQFNIVFPNTGVSQDPYIILLSSSTSGQDSLNKRNLMPFPI